MFCKYCGQKIPDGGVCSCPMAKRIAMQNGRQNPNAGGQRQPVRGSAMQSQGGSGRNYKPDQRNSAPKNKSGKQFFIISIGLSAVLLIVFILLRFVLADVMMDSFLSGIYPYLMYTIPVIIGIAACLFAVFSFQDKGVRTLSLIALIIGIILTAAVVVTMVVFPYEEKVITVGKDDDEKEDKDKADEENANQDDDKDNDVSKKSDDDKDSGKNTEVEQLKNAFEKGKMDYVQVRQALNELNIKELSDEDSETVIRLQEEAEENLVKEIKDMIASSDYLEAFGRMTNIEETLDGDAFVLNLKEKYEPDFVIYLDSQSKKLAEEGQVEEAKKLLEEAKGYLSDLRIAQDLLEDVEKIESAANDYILPDSNSRYLTQEDIKGLSLQEINYAKNEIYARHGRRFNSKELQDYFNSKSWYNGTIAPDNFSSSVFNAYEKKNAQFLSDVEFSIDSRGYQLDVH